MNDTVERRRATSMEELREKMSAMFAGASTGGAPFEPRPTDVIISPFSKCGTTWLQQIFHTLRTRGDTDYDDISRVVPWIETAAELGIDLNAEQRAEPRGYKSHLAYDHVPKGARYIVSIRDPRDALASAYKFMEGWFLEPGTVSLDEFARASFLQRPEKQGYWYHLASWWQHRDDDNVLLLSYEGMKVDPERAIRQIAAFCDISLDAELLRITLYNSSLEFMLAHKDMFDDKLMRELSERAAGLPHGSDSAKVREGIAGGHVHLVGDDVLKEMDEIWRRLIDPQLGYSSYPELEAALRSA